MEEKIRLNIELYEKLNTPNFPNFFHIFKLRLKQLNNESEIE